MIMARKNQIKLIIQFCIKSEHGEDTKLYDKFDLVFSGHYHHKSSHGNIHYLGAFAEYTWSDYNDPRGFTIFDTDTREFEFIRNPISIYKMIAYDDVNTPDIIQKINQTDYSEYRNTYVKVLSVKRENTYAFDQLIDKLYKAYVFSLFTDNTLTYVFLYSE